MFRFHVKMLRHAQGQAQEKGKVLIGFRLCLLHFLFLCQGHFHGEIRTHALALVSVQALKSKKLVLKTNYKKTQICS